MKRDQGVELLFKKRDAAPKELVFSVPGTNDKPFHITSE